MAFLTALAAVAVLLTLLGYYVVPVLWGIFMSPLRHLPGPSSPSILWGVTKVIDAHEGSVLQEQWTEQYGPTIGFRVLFGSRRLWTVDIRALSHILHRADIYQKPMFARYHLSRLLGPGVLISEDEQHKNQRRVLNPAFGPSQIKELTEIFTEKANQVRHQFCVASYNKSSGGPTRINGVSWLSRATLDMIGLAGFNYNFEALNPSGQINELNQAFRTLFDRGGNIHLFSFLQALIPALRIIRTERNRQEASALAVMHRIGKQLIAEKKATIIEAVGQKGRGIEKKDMDERDLLSLLIKANMAIDIPDSQRLSDDEILAQVPTFIVAGHETTSVATTWCLYQLTQSPDVQMKLREELLQVSTDDPTMDELNGLPYLDMFVKEILRHHSPVPMTLRMAMQDDMIPVDLPFTDKKGRVRDHIEIKKGEMVVIPIQSINRSKELWGQDAHEFRPERWKDVPEKANHVPGVWANQMTFLGGPHACIGYRFSLAETKALLFALVRAFEFELAVKPEEIRKIGEIVQRPFLVDGLKLDMPLLIRPYRAF